ncbi:hypothetical protein DV532_19400 [Pseudomonas sp. Leaf58]|nr:hypothetical protein DV532_19400 [Pseudomonas sp. Leaf58]KQN60233.1 hypothetical protein ASF02_17255 [Pseudomonas sp. Leaf58]
MALFCIFVSFKRQPRKQALFDRFSSARTALYTVPVQFRDMSRGKVGLRVGMATPQISPGL